MSAFVDGSLKCTKRGRGESFPLFPHCDIVQLHIFCWSEDGNTQYDISDINDCLSPSGCAMRLIIIKCVREILTEHLQVCIVHDQIHESTSKVIMSCLFMHDIKRTERCSSPEISDSMQKHCQL